METNSAGAWVAATWYLWRRYPIPICRRGILAGLTSGVIYRDMAEGQGEGDIVRRRLGKNCPVDDQFACRTVSYWRHHCRHRKRIQGKAALPSLWGFGQYGPAAPGWLASLGCSSHSGTTINAGFPTVIHEANATERQSESLQVPDHLADGLRDWSNSEMHTRLDELSNLSIPSKSLSLDVSESRIRQC